eukprot:CAMPEP_0119333166 /NCGR_PEP_ID=MMETSP1333-20130426/84513_1 /TAXON_ID=418940 /ORGANISM="Scyphosphaera apsteinii, Strain RCC1455" /LENGTH=336 /DNA_ID=CAMNT_0007343149 /DNA_START=147 /DNA_END=1157 /DNA_ORIENTATION=+
MICALPSAAQASAPEIAATDSSPHSLSLADQCAAGASSTCHREGDVTLKVAESRCILQGRWVYIVGDSSARMLFAGLIHSKLELTTDRHFGSYLEHHKSGCFGVGVNGKSGFFNTAETDSHRSSACLREYVDLALALRITYSFQTFANQHIEAVRALTSPSQVPDLWLLAVGPWDFAYTKHAVNETYSLVVARVQEIHAKYPSSWVAVATVVACDNGNFSPRILPFNALLRAHQWGGRTFLLDREPSTIKENVTRADWSTVNKDGIGRSFHPGTELRCEGFHAYGPIALHHLDLLINMYSCLENHTLSTPALTQRRRRLGTLTSADAHGGEGADLM